MKIAHYLFVKFCLTVLVVAGLVACAQMGLAPAKTFDEKLAYAYGTHTAVLQAAASAVSNKELSSADGVQVLKLADESRTLLDAAKMASGLGDMSTANGKLLLATSILTQLQAYLRSKQ